ncbi:mitoferrin-1-like isoform X1 [Palaemon carinicauda]|uniref:mitoferrin-1-like isoform X1 n=1 Tax=Palaemon carinicauda TaxID=392227 RepID=UPI0035B613BF
MGQLKKLLNETLQLMAHKIEPAGSNKDWAYVTFRNEKSRTKALTVLDEFKWKKCVLSCSTRMQSLAPSPEAAYKSIREGLVKMVNSKGIMRPLGGVNAVIIGAGPAHALYFSAYEGIKTKFSTNNCSKSYC